MGLIYKTYAKLFSKKYFYKFNRSLYYIGLRGMGFLNAENNKISGESFIIQKYINENTKIVFDIGANVGDFTQEVLDLFPNMEIHCFEPNPTTFDKLKNRFAKFKNVHLNNKAVGEFQGEMILYDSGNGTEHATLISGIIESAYNKPHLSNSVDVISIDDYLQKNKILNVDFLKVDVEGFEYAVFTGAKNTIAQKKIKTILFEANFMNIFAKKSIQDFENILSNYQLYRVLPKDILPIINMSISEKEIFLFQNLLAIVK